MIPPLPDLWPPAPGEYVVVSLAVGLVAWLRLRKRRRVARSLYRRQALEELERIAASFDDETSPSPLGPEGMRMGRSNRGFGGRGGSRR